jgi:hypothetical protein
MLYVWIAIVTAIVVLIACWGWDDLDGDSM